jgi:hypothetical protein
LTDYINMGSERPPAEMLTGETLMDILLKIALVSSHGQGANLCYSTEGMFLFGTCLPLFEEGVGGGGWK